ncbi:restriction endonuclease subunit S [Nocardiopsis alba]|uniref:restriction endonuclease subunit S n=1 Tax=Nocardiopsis alba TaxID=53437 RepID=UPI003D742BA2
MKRATTLLNRGSAPNYVDEGPVRAISQASNQAHGIDWTKTRFHEHKGDPASLKGYLTSEDILINSTGTGTLGRVGFFKGSPDEIPCMADSHITVIRAEKEVLYPRFSYYWMTSSQFYDYIYSALVVGATNQIELNRDKLAEAPIPLPPLEEQRRIADFLDAETGRIDRIVSLQSILKAKLIERDKAFRDGLIDELAEVYGVIPLRRMTNRITQGSSPQCDATPRKDESEWGVLKLSAVKQGRFFPRENKRLPEDILANQEYEVKRGDLLVTRANTPALVGDIAVAMGDFRRLLLPDLIYRVDLAPGTNAEFIAQAALSSRSRLLIESVARGSSQSMVKLRGEDIKAWPIPSAPPEKQNAIVCDIERELATTSRLRAAIDHQLELLAERRRALITAAVTGQFDVSTASRRAAEE